MRFVLFNIVVAGALVFLFTSDKADLQAAAGRAHETATALKAKAFEVIGAKKAPAVSHPPKVAAETPSIKPIEKKVVAAPVATDTPAPEAEKSAAKEAIREVQVATRKLVAPLPPEVEKRRDEILTEGVVGGKISVPAGSDHQKFMTTSDRKRDLMLLSEEMELFSARSISR